jgi:hypothetical protein
MKRYRPAAMHLVADAMFAVAFAVCVTLIRPFNWSGWDWMDDR